MKYIFAAIVSILLIGCAAQINPVSFSGPNGKQAYSMQCSGMMRTLDMCYQKAGELCPSGYSIIDRATGTVSVPTSTGGFIMAPQHSLAIECK